MFDHLYRDELASLREAAPALAQRHPQLAAQLAAPGDDPDVERLLQGFAFVAARLRQRIDAAAPELVEALLAQLFPAALRPLPAATIVAFEPPSSLRGVQRIPRGALLRTREVDGTRCTFSTTRALRLAPIALTSVRLEGSDSRAPELTLRFTASEDASWAREDAPLRLHLHGDAALADQLGLWLTRHLGSARVRDDEGNERVLGGPEAVRPIALDDDDTLLPWPDATPPGIRVLEEAFALPAKLRFFDVRGLVRASELMRGGFALVLRFEHPPPLHARLPDDLVRLHCVPAVNLFAVDAEPIRADLGERPVLLRAAGLEPAHMEVFDVRSVTGMGPAGARVAYPCASAIGAGSDAAGRYRLTRQPSPVDGGIHTYLGLHRSVARARAVPEETLSVALLCSNRDLPRALGLGDVATPTAPLPPGVTFANITPITAPRRPPLGEARMWQLVALLGGSRRSLSDAASLRAWLALHAGATTQDRRDDPRITAVRHVEARTITRVWGGAGVRGSHFLARVDAGGFASEGEAHAFGALIHHMLAVDAKLNSFADLTLELEPSGTRFEYRSDPSW